MPLLARTVNDRTIMMANHIEATQLKDINAAPFFSLALDESTDVSHLYQFSMIERYAVGDTLREKSLAVLPMKGTTRREDLCKSFTELLKKKKNYRWINLFQRVLMVLRAWWEKKRIHSASL